MTLPEGFEKAARSVEGSIRAAFNGATRSGGVSWSESRVIDNNGSDEERAAARRLDTERCWEDLVDDPNWDEEPGIGGFSFLDAIGFAYYLAPAMIRCTRRGGGQFVSYALLVDGAFRREQIRSLDAVHLAAIARFVRFMIVVQRASGDEISGESWQHAYRAFWREWDQGEKLEL